MRRIVAVFDLPKPIPRMLCIRMKRMLGLICLLLSLVGCAYRPDYHRTSIDELIQQSLDQSNASTGGDPEMIGNVHDHSVVVDGVMVDHGDTVIIEEEHSIDGFSQTPQEEIIPLELIPISQARSSQIARVNYDEDYLINEEFIETDVREVLTLLATDANLDLVLDDNVAGIVNAQINDLTVDEAVEKVLLPLGLASSRSCLATFRDGVDQDPVSTSAHGSKHVVGNRAGVLVAIRDGDRASQNNAGRSTTADCQ
mgnify:CR=1 FL=1